jgi:5'-deoxynucleotidase YfbR-like HD superfamily hydrolase
MPDRAGAPPRAWQRMLSGRRLDLLDPSPLDIEPEDIAHGLARVARWNGQTVGDHAFSVAQHSLLVERIVLMQHPAAGGRERLATLLHDAPEYVIGDIISPFKAVLGGSYREIEARLHIAVRLRFGLPPDLPRALEQLIKKADQTAAYFEAVELADFSEAEAARFFGRPGKIAIAAISPLMKPWPAKRAEARYLAALRSTTLKYAASGAEARPAGQAALSEALR